MFGYQFSPDAERAARKSVNNIPDGQLRPQATSALRVLSLRLPTVLGGRPIAPEDLLKPAVGAGTPMGAVGSTLAHSMVPPMPVGNGPDVPAGAVPDTTGGPTAAPLVVSMPSSPFTSGTPDQSSLEALVGNALSPPSPRFAADTTYPPRLHENVDHVTVLVDRPPQILPAALDGHEQFIQIPRCRPNGYVAA